MPVLQRPPPSRRMTSRVGARDVWASFACFTTLPTSGSCRCMDLLFRLLQPRSSRYFFVVASFLALAVVNGSLRHSPGTPQHRSFPQLNFHRARVHRNRQRPRANDFTGRAQNSPPAFTPQGQRASGKVLTSPAHNRLANAKWLRKTASARARCVGYAPGKISPQSIRRMC